MTTTNSRPRRPARERRCPARRSPRPGFSFIEVLFAVMILGIGFILTAGIFPVAARQLESTADETAAAATARGGFAQLRTAMTAANTPATEGAVRSVSGGAPVLWRAIGGSLISSGDPRFAWVPVYRRDDDSGVARVTIFVVRKRTGSGYRPADLTPSPAAAALDAPAALEPKTVAVTFVRNADGPDVVRFTDPSAPAVAAVAPGSYLVTSSPGALGETAGRVVRVGNYVGVVDGDAVWELMPGNDLKGYAESWYADPMAAMLVGRGYADPADPAKGYDGPSQDVSVYSTLIGLR